MRNARKLFSVAATAIVVLGLSTTSPALAQTPNPVTKPYLLDTSIVFS